MTSIQELTLGDVSRENARRFRAHAAFVTEQGSRLTYAELDTRATQLANALRTDGIGAGDRLLWVGQNSFRVFELLIAASKVGACVCVANWRNTAAELAHILDDWSPALIVWQETEVGAPEALAGPWGSKARWLQHDGDGPESYEAYLVSGSAVDDERPVSADAPVLAVYTAAFGGQPRAALLTSGNLLAMAATVIIVRQFTVADRMLVTAPAFHIMFCAEALPIFLVGGLNVFVRRVEPQEICRLIEAHACTRAYLVSITRDQVVALQASSPRDLTSLISAGTPEWEALVTPDLTPYGLNGGMYGQTEVSGVVSYGAYGAPAIGIAGRPGPFGLVRIWDDEGKELPVGSVGEIVVRGPMLMAGYHGDDEGTARMNAQGWRRTNDLGRREDDGSISFVAPKGRIVKSGVENIYPVEVERCIAALEGVAECAIIGVPDPQWTQVVKAIVVLEPGADVQADGILRHCIGSIASYKKPKQIEFVEALPKAGGAVDYAALDLLFGGGNYPGGTTRPM
jgi:acyl-CoA synthetase (AMP-forming)/AMP-acid ligase II